VLPQRLDANEMDMAQEIKPKYVASGNGPAPANEKRRVNSRRSTSDERSTNLIAANSANDWRMEIGHVHRDGGPLMGLLSIVTLLILASAQPVAAAYRGRKKTATRAPTCIQVVQQTHSRRYPDCDLPPTESPLSHSGMSGRVYDPVSTVSAIARGGARFRSAKFDGNRRDQHELQSE
jgi:hypothetical protein